MPIYMYGCIEQWFKKYRFEDPVMVMLFSVSNEKGALTRNYIEAVAKDWFENGVKRFLMWKHYLRNGTR